MTISMNKSVIYQMECKTYIVYSFHVTKKDFHTCTANPLHKIFLHPSCINFLILLIFPYQIKKKVADLKFHLLDKFGIDDIVISSHCFLILQITKNIFETKIYINVLKVWFLQKQSECISGSKLFKIHNYISNISFNLLQ